ncbi:MAG: UDP-N-acetylmuramate--L-alanine ligase [Bacteroidota bacterium]
MALNINDIKKVYFIGIGGIGMSAIARYFNQRGISVSGYDKTPTALTHLLESEGIHIHFDDNIEKAPQDADLVVYTPAIPKDHSELKMYQNSTTPLMKRSEVLGLISKDSFCIAVSGSHGKTTVSSMITHILKDSGYDCSAFLGGISVNLNSNYTNGKNNVVVVEADEYDRSFHRLSPDIAVITAVDTDHLDIYGTKEKIEEAFVIFTDKIKNNGKVVANKEVQILEKVKQTTITYHLDNHAANCYTIDYIIKDGAYEIRLNDIHNNEQTFTLNIAGYHNIENALAAISVAQLLEISFDKIAHALASFKGIKRRFEYIYKSEYCIYIDDYAHHPQEIDVFLGSLKEMYPTKKITAIFQPHLFSRTNDLQVDFAKSLSQIDTLYLLDIYPAREKPMEGVTSQLILDKVTIANKMILSKEEVLQKIKSHPTDIIVTIGAGDIDTMIPKIKTILEAKHH